MFLTRILTNLIVNGALHFFFGYFNTGFVADFRKNEAKTNAAFSKLAIFGACFFFRCIFVFKGLASLCKVLTDLSPDIVELGVDQTLWQLELVFAIQRIQNLTLHFLACERTVLALDLLRE